MTIRKLISDNLPVILTSVAITGVVSTTVLAVRATPQAAIDIGHAESEFGRDLTRLEKVRLVWKDYIPAAVVGAATISAIVGVQSTHSKRQAALAGLLSVVESNFSEFREKTIATIGERKHRDMNDEIAQDHIEKNPVSNNVVILSGKGEHLCYDDHSGRYFKSSLNEIQRAVNEVNAECINNSYSSLNDFYRHLGIPVLPDGEEIGWRPDKLLEIIPSTALAEDSTPCLVMNYSVNPIRGYWRGHD